MRKWLLLRSYAKSNYSKSSNMPSINRKCLRMPLFACNKRWVPVALQVAVLDVIVELPIVIAPRRPRTALIIPLTIPSWRLKLIRPPWSSLKILFQKRYCLRLPVRKRRNQRLSSCINSLRHLSTCYDTVYNRFFFRIRNKNRRTYSANIINDVLCSFIRTKINTRDRKRLSRRFRTLYSVCKPRVLFLNSVEHPLLIYMSRLIFLTITIH